MTFKVFIFQDEKMDDSKSDGRHIRGGLLLVSFDVSALLDAVVLLTCFVVLSYFC